MTSNKELGLRRRHRMAFAGAVSPARAALEKACFESRRDGGMGSATYAALNEACSSATVAVLGGRLHDWVLGAGYAYIKVAQYKGEAWANAPGFAGPPARVLMVSTLVLQRGVSFSFPKGLREELKSAAGIAPVVSVRADPELGLIEEWNYSWTMELGGPRILFLVRACLSAEDAYDALGGE